MRITPHGLLFHDFQLKWYERFHKKLKKQAFGHRRQLKEKGKLNKSGTKQDLWHHHIVTWELVGAGTSDGTNDTAEDGHERETQDSNTNHPRRKDNAAG